MSIARELREATRLGVGGVAWKVIGDEVWQGSNFLFYTKRPKLAEHIVRLHNVSVSASNLLTKALKQAVDLRKLLEVAR